MGALALFFGKIVALTDANDIGLEQGARWWVMPDSAVDGESPTFQPLQTKDLVEVHAALVVDEGMITTTEHLGRQNVGVDAQGLGEAVQWYDSHDGFLMSGAYSAGEVAMKGLGPF